MVGYSCCTCEVFAHDDLYVAHTVISVKKKSIFGRYRNGSTSASLGRWSASRRQLHGGEFFPSLQPAWSRLHATSSTASPSRRGNRQSRHPRSPDYRRRTAGRGETLFVGGLTFTAQAIAESCATRSIRKHVVGERRAAGARQVRAG